MNPRRLLAVMAAIICAGISAAHQGVPGHAHPEHSLADQLLHAAQNWAPVLSLALITAVGFLRATRRA